MRSSRIRLLLFVVPALFVTVLSLNALITARAEGALISTAEPDTDTPVILAQDLSGQPGQVGRDRVFGDRWVGLLLMFRHLSCLDGIGRIVKVADVTMPVDGNVFLFQV